MVLVLVAGFEVELLLLLEEEEDGSEELALLLSDGSPIGSEVLLSELSDGSALSDVVEAVDWKSWSTGKLLKESGAPQATSASRSSTLSTDKNTLFIGNAFLDRFDRGKRLC